MHEFVQIVFPIWGHRSQKMTLQTAINCLVNRVIPDGMCVYLESTATGEVIWTSVDDGVFCEE